jgi:methyl-branched lipid omega-hydroxylase
MAAGVVARSGTDLSDPAFWERPRSAWLGDLHRLRREHPVAWQRPATAWAPATEIPPRGYWAVLGHADVRRASRDPATYSSARGVLPFDNLAPDVQYLFDGFLGLDAPRHPHLRRVVARAFTPRVVRELRDWIEHEARAAVAHVADRGACDFYRDLAAPFPVAVICDVMGVPAADRPELIELMDIGLSFSARVRSFEESMTAVRAVLDYGLALGRDRRARPREDLMTALVAAEVDGAALTDDDIASAFWLIVTGGGETTGTTAAHGLLALSEFPAERRRWEADYEALAPTAVEELLRWAAPVVGQRRTATRDTEIAGQPIGEGENVLLVYAAANHDETAFAQPDRLDLARDPNLHVTFGGGGPHFCLGNALARLELRALFRELFRVLPDIELAAEPVRVAGPFLDGFESMPCTFSPRSRG